MEKPKGKSTWRIIIKVSIAVASAIGGVLGIQICILFLILNKNDLRQHQFTVSKLPAHYLDSSSLFCHARRPQLPGGSSPPLSCAGTRICRYRLSLLHHPRRYHPCLPPDRPYRRPCPLFQRPQHRSVLRRRSGRTGTTCRHTDHGTENRADSTVAATSAGLSRSPHCGTQ